MTARTPSTPSEQHKRFVEAAKELGTDTTEGAFKRAVGKIAKAVPAKNAAKKPKK